MCPRGARLFTGKGGLLEPTKVVAHCLLIETDGELILVDTGFGLGDCSDPNRLGRPFRAMSAPICEERESAIRQIEALGHDPADVRHILTTHLDLDHAGGIADFPEAQIHVFAAELAAARSPSLKERTRYISAQWGERPIWVEHGAGGDSWLGFESIPALPRVDAEIAMIPPPRHPAGPRGGAPRPRDRRPFPRGGALLPPPRAHGRPLWCRHRHWRRLALPLWRCLLPPRRDRDAASLPARLARLPEPQPTRRHGAAPKPGAAARAPARSRRGGHTLLLP